MNKSQASKSVKRDLGDVIKQMSKDSAMPNPPKPNEGVKTLKDYAPELIMAFEPHDLGIPYNLTYLDKYAIEKMLNDLAQQVYSLNANVADHEQLVHKQQQHIAELEERMKKMEASRYDCAVCKINGLSAEEFNEHADIHLNL